MIQQLPVGMETGNVRIAREGELLYSISQLVPWSSAAVGRMFPLLFLAPLKYQVTLRQQDNKAFNGIVIGNLQPGKSFLISFSII